MWKSRPDDKPTYTPPASTQPTVTPAPSFTPPNRTVETPRMDQFRADIAHIGKSVIVKGELSGSEDLYLDGEIEGSIELRNHSLVIGPNGRIRANVHAKDVVVHGKVDGNVRGNDRVELKKSAQVNGDIITQRIVIEDGAYLKGAIDIQKVEKPTEQRREIPVTPASTTNPAAPANVSTSAQTSLLDRK